MFGQTISHQNRIISVNIQPDPVALIKSMNINLIPSPVNIIMTLSGTVNGDGELQNYEINNENG